jgi:hypothetical protein
VSPSTVSNLNKKIYAKIEAWRSRVNREVHARFWERAEVKFLRATRQSRHSARVPSTSAVSLKADIRLRRNI